MFTVRVSRFDPSVDQAAHLDTLQVPVPPNEKWTVMDVLDYIRLHLDGSLSYYRHSACDHGICGRCVARVNGKARLICQHIVPEQGELVIEPLANKTVVKDLVVRYK